MQVSCAHHCAHGIRTCADAAAAKNSKVIPRLCNVGTKLQSFGKAASFGKVFCADAAASNNSKAIPHTRIVPIDLQSFDIVVSLGGVFGADAAVAKNSKVIPRFCNVGIKSKVLVRQPALVKFSVPTRPPPIIPRLYHTRASFRSIFNPRDSDGAVDHRAPPSAFSTGDLCDRHCFIVQCARQPAGSVS